LSWKRGNTSPLAQLLAKSHLYYINAYKKWEGIDGCYPHDTIAVVAASKPELFYYIRGRICIVKSGMSRGQTTFTSDDASHVQVATGGNLKWIREFITELNFVP